MVNKHSMHGVQFPGVYQDSKVSNNAIVTVEEQCTSKLQHQDDIIIYSETAVSLKSVLNKESKMTGIRAHRNIHDVVWFSFAYKSRKILGSESRRLIAWHVHK